MNIYKKEPARQAEACIIWMHGLGADASDMAGLAEQLSIHSVAFRHVFIDAAVRPITLNNGIAMRAWYDIFALELTSREDKEGILESEAIIRQVIDAQLQEGLQPQQIFLAGFSQGGAMALHTALHSTMSLGGAIVLSAYLPLALECKAELPKDTPLFIAWGDYDPIVMPAWTQQSINWLTTTGYNQITLRHYPMEHAVCAEEIRDISTWILAQVKGEVA